MHMFGTISKHIRVATDRILTWNSTGSYNYEAVSVHFRYTFGALSIHFRFTFDPLYAAASTLSIPFLRVWYTLGTVYM